MKRIISIFVLACLLFIGCASEKTQETTEATTQEPTVETTVPGTYIEGSAAEQQTDGAVRAYSLNGKKCLWVKSMASDLLLKSAENEGELIVLTGEKRYISAEGVVLLPENATHWKITSMGLAYYSAEERSVIYLDTSLRQIDAVELPAIAVGEPVIDPYNNLIYYTTGMEIRAYDPDTKVSRLIRKFASGKAELIDIYFDGKVVACRAYDENGPESVIYIATDSGKTVGTDQKIISLYTYADNYFAMRQDGTIRQNIIGIKQKEITANDLQLTGQLIPALSLGGIVSHEIAGAGINLNFYSVEDGKRTSAVTIPGVTKLISITSDKTYVWILAEAEEEQVLYRWNIAKSAVEDDSIYTDNVYTEENPDMTGLDECQSRVDALNKKHGIDIRIWKNALNEQGEYVLLPEYQTKAINKCLDELEQVLDLFPENFLYKSVNKRVRICIVRSVSDEVKAVQYWVKDDAFIVLSAGVDIYEGFLRAVGYVVSTNVMGNSSILDSWTSVNPVGFEYGNGADEYLTGVNKAFADKQSMSSITEDRSRLFWYAMKEENSMMFQSEIMQEKLVLLCKGIRDAWNLKRKPDVYPWEQYLHESIAYVKK